MKILAKKTLETFIYPVKILFIVLKVPNKSDKTSTQFKNH